jgi:hypothetical protein
MIISSLDRNDVQVGYVALFALPMMELPCAAFLGKAVSAGAMMTVRDGISMHSLGGSPVHRKPEIL